MTVIEILKRKITLKRQYLTIVTDQTNTEIEALERELKDLEGDPEPVRDAGEKAQRAPAL